MQIFCFPFAYQKKKCILLKDILFLCRIVVRFFCFFGKNNEKPVESKQKG